MITVVTISAYFQYYQWDNFQYFGFPVRCFFLRYWDLLCLHFTALTVLLTLEDSIHFFSFHIFLFQLRKFRQYRGKLGLKRQKHNCKLVHNGRGNKHEKIESTKNAEAKSKACECFVQWLIGFRVLLHHAFTHCNLKSGTLERSGQRNLSIFSTLEFPKSSNDIEQRQTFEFFDTNVRQL